MTTSSLGPLHNPANIQGIEACQKMMPDTPNVAVFDTAFHQTMPDYAYMYAVPYDYYDPPEGSPLRLPRHLSPLSSPSVRRRCSAPRTARALSSSSATWATVLRISAVKDGKCVDTSMGITPLEGMVMGTRSGDIDAAALQYIMKRDGIGIEEMTDHPQQEVRPDGRFRRVLRYA